MQRRWMVTVLVGLAIVLAACASATEAPPLVVDPEVEEPMTVVDIAAADGRFSTLVGALQATNLDEALYGEGPFTVFAPTDDAFAQLPEGTLDALSNEELSNVLLYHVLSGEVMAEQVLGLDGQRVPTLLGEELSIGVNGSVVTINGIQVIITDIIASNGVIHVIEQVLLPPAEPTIVELAAADGRFSTLVGALQATGLDEALSGDGPFTVFAPTDDAFAALPEGTLEGLTEEQLSNVLLYHVISGEVMAADAIALDGISAETLLGESFNIRVEDGSVFINDAQVIITDLAASNGVIHVIDSVLLPPSLAGESRSIVEIAVEDGRFTTLVGALQTTGLDDALSGEGPFTVFAPTDDAFAALPAGTLESLSEAELTNILLYHVVDGAVLAADVVGLDGETVETLLGEGITIRIEGENVFINEALVIITDIEASNGVIHVIDSVLLPPQ